MFVAWCIFCVFVLTHGYLICYHKYLYLREHLEVVSFLQLCSVCCLSLLLSNHAAMWCLLAFSKISIPALDEFGNFFWQSTWKSSQLAPGLVPALGSRGGDAEGEEIARLHFLEKFETPLCCGHNLWLGSRHILFLIPRASDKPG